MRPIRRLAQCYGLELRLRNASEVGLHTGWCLESQLLV